jgi:hypothetical protein
MNSSPKRKREEESKRGSLKKERRKKKEEKGKQRLYLEPVPPRSYFMLSFSLSFAAAYPRERARLRRVFDVSLLELETRDAPARNFVCLISRRRTQEPTVANSRGTRYGISRAREGKRLKSPRIVIRAVRPRREIGAESSAAARFTPFYRAFNAGGITGRPFGHTGTGINLK